MKKDKAQISHLISHPIYLVCRVLRNSSQKSHFVKQKKDESPGMRNTDRREEVKRNGLRPYEYITSWKIKFWLWVWTCQGDRVLQWAAVGWKTTDRLSHPGRTWRSPSSSPSSVCLCVHVTQSERQTGTMFTQQPNLICFSQIWSLVLTVHSESG